MRTPGWGQQGCTRILTPGSSARSVTQRLVVFKLTLSITGLNEHFSPVMTEKPTIDCLLMSHDYLTLSIVSWFFSLRDTLVSYMETKDSEIPPEMESQFPEEILLSSCVAVWKMAAELKRNRQMR